MPANIGAGIGGGEADNYHKEIGQFVRDFPSLLVTLWKRPKGGGKMQDIKRGVLSYDVSALDLHSDLGAAKQETALQPLDSSESPPPHKFDYDLTVIGGGPAGVKAAKQAHEMGKRVALVHGCDRCCTDHTALDETHWCTHTEYSALCTIKLAL